MTARVVFLALLLSGCASWPALFGRGAERVVAAETLVARGAYVEALRAYDEILEHPGSEALAARARAGRTAVAALLGARGDADRLRDLVAARERELARARADLEARETEAARLGRDLAARDAELVRARHEVTAKQAEVTAKQAEVARLEQETETLKANLEQLTRIDLRLERRRP
jgi:chromosome segregation ATPase